MNFHVYLDDELGRQVQQMCENTHKKRNAIIREALRLYLQQQKGNSWPESVLKFQGAPAFPAFESFRSELPQESRDSFLD